MNFIRIIWITYQHDGLRRAWRRFRLGLRGYVNKQCAECRRWKGRTCSTLCPWCQFKTYEPLMAAVK